MLEGEGESDTPGVVCLGDSVSKFGQIKLKGLLRKFSYGIYLDCLTKLLIFDIKTLLSISWK